MKCFTKQITFLNRKYPSFSPKNHFFTFLEDSILVPPKVRFQLGDSILVPPEVRFSVGRFDFIFFHQVRFQLGDSILVPPKVRFSVGEGTSIGISLTFLVVNCRVHSQFFRSKLHFWSSIAEFTHNFSEASHIYNSIPVPAKMAQVIINQMSKSEVEQMNLENFVDRYSCLGSHILSFLFADRDYELEYKYDRFYETIDISRIAANFEICYKSDIMCRRVVDMIPMYLPLVPDSMKSKRMCEIAVMDAPHLMKEIPQDMIDIHMARTVIHVLPDMFAYVPDNVKDASLCYDAVTQSGSLIVFVPEQYLNYDIYLASVRIEPMLFLRVPDAFKSGQMCTYASNNPGMLAYIPMAKRTRAICVRVVHRYGEFLIDVPIHLRDAAMCTIAVQSDYRATSHIPHNVFTQDLCDIILLRCITQLVFLPRKFIRQEHYILAVRAKVVAYQDVPDHMKTYEMSVKEFKGRLSVLTTKLVPARFLTPQFYKDISNKIIVID